MCMYIHDYACVYIYTQLCIVYIYMHLYIYIYSTKSNERGWLYRYVCWQLSFLWLSSCGMCRRWMLFVPCITSQQAACLHWVYIYIYIWLCMLSSTPRWHTCGQSSHQKPKQLSGRSSYSYSSQDSCRPFGVEMAWPVFSHKLPWSAWAEAPEAKRISDMLLKREFVLSLGGSRTTPRLLRRGQQWDKGLWKSHI